MDDKNWDDYLRETPGTTFGDEAIRARERSQPNAEGAVADSSTQGKWEPSDAAVKVFLAAIYTFAFFYAAITQLELRWGWMAYLGIWAGLSIVQFIWPIMFRVMGYMMSTAIFGALAYYIYQLATT